MLKINRIFFGFLVSITALLAASFAFAQDFGIEPVDNTIMLASGDPRVIIGRIIQIALAFLGVIMLGLIIYAGFLWMTSGGDEEQIRKAKSTLRNAIIGLLITLASWAIATFVIARLFEATTGQGGGQQITTPGNFVGHGLGAIGACSVQSVYPENGQKNIPRNTAIIVSFNEEIGLASACVNGGGTACACDNAACSLINPAVIRIYNSDLGDACKDSCPTPNANITDVSVAVSADKKTMVLSPLSYLGSAERNTPYEVKVTTDLKKTDGSSMLTSCRSGDLRWGFEVSTNLDLTPPQVVAASLFPQPDNVRDAAGVSVPAARARAEIQVNACAKIYAPASVLSVQPNTEVSLNYHGTDSHFIVVIPADTSDKAQLFNGTTNALLGIADFNAQNIVSFPNYLSLKAEGRQSGDRWVINIRPEQLADSLRVGNMNYVFAASSGNNNIPVPNPCNAVQQAANIEAVLSGHPDIEVTRSSSRVMLAAKMAGSAGNDLILNSSNYSALNLLPFSGGANQTSSYTVNGRKDAAMNTIIKIGFNEAMNPVTLSGTAAEVSGAIRVINAAGGAAGGAACSLDSDCLSYHCSNFVCAGDYVNGRFLMSNNYKTVEFISDNECGINGCGEKVYCLPPNSNLAVEIRAANLKPCENDQQCAAFSPFNICGANQLGGRSCRDANLRSYPMANILNLGGASDIAFNSLDGNRDGGADGPLRFFNENDGNKDNKDSYRYSFFVNDQKELSSPQVTAIKPISGATELSALADPVEIVFNTLMMSSTLKSGGSKQTSNAPAHKYINLRSAAATPLGYWLDSQDRDSAPTDGVVDITVAFIKHSPFLESISYSAQIGSGVKDIYQNCFKPSSGPGCEADWEQPSCCFGLATSELDASGNCK